MTTRYYRVNNKTAMDAWRDFLADRQAMLDSAKPLAERFDGKILSSTSITESRFAGLSLNKPPENPELWTKPDKKSANIQRPRKSVPATLKAELKKLNKEWDFLYPEVTRVSKDSLYKAIGIDLGQLLFSGGYEIFEHDDVLWISIGVEIIGGEEIKGSDFDAAHKAYKQALE